MAGYLLRPVPGTVGPKPSFTGAANAFVVVAEKQYGSETQVAAAVRKTFHTDAGLTSGPPACIPAAPPPSPPPSQVVAPNLQGDSPGAASAELSNVGRRLGTQTEVVDNVCNAIGQVLSQTPAAGTVVAPASAVDIRLGKRPSHPCP